MAFDKTPTAWIPSYTFATPNMTLSRTAAFTDITDVEAHATTGDIRQIYYGFCQQMYNAYNAKAAADKPVRMTLNKSVNVDTISGINTVNFSFSFQCDNASLDVTAE